MKSWGKPIHQLLIDNNVTIFFHGHDHFYAKQELDGVIYQGCPQPGAINDRNHADEYGYKNGTFMDGSGHMRVTVSEEQVTVDYIQTYLPGYESAGRENGEIAFSSLFLGLSNGSHMQNEIAGLNKVTLCDLLTS